jgi:hypothetical protein
MLGPRVVIPEALRREALDNLLLMHQGATKLRQRARLTMFWPSMDNDIVTAMSYLHGLPPVASAGAIITSCQGLQAL